MSAGFLYWLKGFNALAGSGEPDVDRDVKAVIIRYGAEAVKASVDRQIKQTRGRKPEKDWARLRSYLEQDAREWLDGGDPLKRRSNYSIAKEFCTIYPGESGPGTFRRIQEKLREKRRIQTLGIALEISLMEYPYRAYVKTLEELSEIVPAFEPTLDEALGFVKYFKERTGTEPPESMSITDVRVAILNMPHGLASLKTSTPA
jgi:hypothetical protein